MYCQKNLTLTYWTFYQFLAYIQIPFTQRLPQPTESIGLEREFSEGWSACRTPSSADPAVTAPTSSHPSDPRSVLSLGSYLDVTNPFSVPPNQSKRNQTRCIWEPEGILESFIHSLMPLFISWAPTMCSALWISLSILLNLTALCQEGIPDDGTEAERGQGAPCDYSAGRWWI